ncbi:MAG: hypothetical protein K2L02_01030 [Clostridia bacterium]|nr:hypothetical protein [Clostridia bacterium]
MTVKEVIALAAGCLGRDDLVSALDKEENALSEDEKLELDALLRAYNFVENEVALDYCPLKKEETVKVSENKIYYSELSSVPVNIRKVVCGGYLARFGTYPAYILLSDGWLGNANVVYDCIPNTKTSFNEESAFSEESGVSARLLALGVAAQYYYVNGENGRAALWDKKFRDALRAKNLLRRTVSVRSRRWV